MLRLLCAAAAAAPRHASLVRRRGGGTPSWPLEPAGRARRARSGAPLAAAAVPASWEALARDAFPLEAVLPPVFLGVGGKLKATDQSVRLAFEGDALLKAAVAKALVATAGPSVPIGTLTALMSGTVSNDVLAAALPYLLPAVADAVPAELRKKHVHEAGTAVEAAVALVARREGGAKAVDDVARYLLHEHRRVGAAVFNPKGRLLEQGGRVRSQSDGGVEHDPRFRATATLGAHTATVEGANSKKTAEKQAALEVLVAAGLVEDVQLDLDREGEGAEESEPQLPPEVQGAFENVSWRPVPTVSSPPDDFSNADADPFERLLAAPAAVSGVSVWVWLGDAPSGWHVAVVRVDVPPDSSAVFVTPAPAPSRRAAKNGAAGAALQFIAQVSE